MGHIGCEQVFFEECTTFNCCFPNNSCIGSFLTAPNLQRRIVVDAKRRIKRALSAVEDAIAALSRARSRAGEGRSEIDSALRELDDAETDLRRALRELPDD